MPERPAPLVLVTVPGEGQAFGTHAAVAADGQRLLATDLSRRLGRLGAAVAPLPTAAAEGFHWGRWFTAAARQALETAAGSVDAIGYAGGGALCLASDDALDALLSPIPGEVVANNRFSADAFVVAGDLARALTALEALRLRQRGAASSQRGRPCVARPRRDAMGAVRRRHHARSRAAAARHAARCGASGGRVAARVSRDGAPARRGRTRGAAPGAARGSDPRPLGRARGGGARAGYHDGGARDRSRLPGAGLRRGAGHAVGATGSAAEVAARIVHGAELAGRADRRACGPGRCGGARLAGPDGGQGRRPRMRLPGPRRKSASPRTSATPRGSRPPGSVS